ERWEAVEIEIMHRDGTTRTGLWNSATLFAPDGKTPIATIAQGQDITAIKNMEKVLLESEARYKLIAENAFDLIALLDSSGRYIYCNHSYLDILGYSPAAMIGVSCFDIIHPEDKEKTIQIFKKCLTEKILEAKLSIRLLCNNGAVKWVDHRARIIVDESSGSMHILLNAMDITESKIADEALRQNQTRFEQLAAQSRTIIWEVNTDGLFTYVSPMTEQLLGYRQIELTGKKHFYELHPEDGREEFKTAAFAVFKRKEQFLNLENRLQTRDGNFIWVSTNGIPVLDADGKLLGYRGSDTDITEHKLTEEALQETKDYLDNLFNHANAPIIVWDSEFRITQFNNAFEKLSGLNVSDVLGKQVDILFPAETREHSIEYIKRTTGGDRWDAVEIQIQHIDGSVRTLLWNSATIYSTDRRTVIGTIAQGHDITERKQAELNRDQLLLFTTALNKIDEVIISQENAEYILETANRIIGETMQVDRSLIYDVSFEQNCITGLCEWLRCDHPDIAPTKAQYPLDMFLSPFTRIMNTRKYLKSYSGAVDEHFIEDGSGKILHENLKIKSLLWYPFDFSEHGYYVFTLNQIIDARQWTPLELNFLESVAQQVSLALMKIRMIEQRNKTEIELIHAKEHAEESDLLKTAFLNNISHEIRTPFNCILGFLAILDDDTLSRDERSEYVSMINQAAERLMNAINDIVEMSKIQTGQVKVTLLETDINKLARDVAERFEPQAKIKNLSFTLKNSLTASNCNIKTDDDKLNSVLGILISNAIKFTKAGSIELVIQSNETWLEFSVKDTGTGIPEDKRDRIFKQFMQVDVSNTRKFEGSGLGLSIAKAYVEMLGGSIGFESQEGRGSTFHFTIPAAKDESKIVAIPETAATTTRIPSKILVAEDDEVNFEYINAVLTRVGYEVLYARTGAEAVDICRNNINIGTIFMDIKMPVMDGYIATREIRKFNPSIPIIAITAYAETGDRKKCLEAGMNDFASKPVTPRDMMEVLDKWLSRENPG
ncbi:MAG: PAS domain S-box protein, partial [Lentisphaerota bacterium]